MAYELPMDLTYCMEIFIQTSHGVNVRQVAKIFKPLVIHRVGETIVAPGNWPAMTVVHVHNVYDNAGNLTVRVYCENE